MRDKQARVYLDMIKGIKKRRKELSLKEIIALNKATTVPNIHREAHKRLRQEISFKQMRERLENN